MRRRRGAGTCWPCPRCCCCCCRLRDARDSLRWCCSLRYSCCAHRGPVTGELWIDARGQGAATTLLLRTHAHLLLVGTGEVHESDGRRFARQLLPQVRAAGYPRIDLWLPGTLTARYAGCVVAGRGGNSSCPRPARQYAQARRRNSAPCTTTNWRWDDIDFEVRDAADGRGVCAGRNARRTTRGIRQGSARARCEPGAVTTRISCSTPRACACAPPFFGYDAGPCGKSCLPAGHSCGPSSCAQSSPAPSCWNACGPCSRSA